MRAAAEPAEDHSTGWAELAARRWIANVQSWLNSRRID